jgi:hypothetical protein
MINMVFYRNGYLAVRPNGSQSRSGRAGEHRYKNWFLIKSSATGVGLFSIGKAHIVMPVEFVGKRVRVKIEVIPDDE